MSNKQNPEQKVRKSTYYDIKTEQLLSQKSQELECLRIRSLSYVSKDSYLRCNQHGVEDLAESTWRVPFCHYQPEWILHQKRLLRWVWGNTLFASSSKWRTESWITGGVVMEGERWPLWLNKLPECYLVPDLLFKKSLYQCRDWRPNW